MPANDGGHVTASEERAKQSCCKWDCFVPPNDVFAGPSFRYIFY
jgi:hypothetical protein